MKSTERNQIISAQLETVMARLGFAAKKAGQGDLFWSSVVDGKYVLIYLQGDKRQWEPTDGSSFYLRTAVHSDENFATSHNRSHLGVLLNQEQLAEAFQLQQRVMAKLDARPANSEFEAKMKELYQGMRQTEMQRPFSAKNEPKFRYADVQDLEAWCAFFNKVLPQVSQGLRLSA